MNEPRKYTIDDLLGDSPVTRALKEPVPEAENNFTDGVSPSSLISGELQGNTTVQDGYLRSKNYVPGVSGWYLDPTTGELNFAVSVDALDIPDTVTVNSFHVDNDGDTWWGATTFGAAVASISKAGAALFSSIGITGTISGASVAGIPNNTTTDLSVMEMSHNLVFSVTDADTVAWASGTIVMSNGRTFSISAGNTGNMSALTYIYLDPAVSSTVLQTTTTYSTAMGNNKRLLGTAQNHTVTASFIPYGPGAPLIDGANIGALSIVAGNIAASTITAGKMSVTQLAAIAADLGAITAGTIVLPSGGYIRSGQTAYNTGTGWYIGNDSGTPKLSIGDSNNYMRWTGSQLELSAVVQTTIPLVTHQPIDGSTTPVPVVIMGDEKIVIGDANDADVDDFIGFITTNTGQTPADFLNASSFTGTSGSVDVNAGTDRLLILWISQGDGGGVTVPSAVTWGATSLTKFSDTTINNENLTGWRAVLGNSGSNQNDTVTITGSSGGEATLAIVYEYVNQTTPLGTAVTTTAAGSAGSISQAITPTNSYSLIASATMMDGTISLDAAMTTRDEDEGSGGYNVEGGDGYYTGLSSVTVTHTVSPNSSNRTIHAVEILHSVSTTAYVVVLGVVPFTGLTIGANYYLSNTAGQISTTPGSTSVKVGKALSSTKLLIVQP